MLVDDGLLTDDYIVKLGSAATHKQIDNDKSLALEFIRKFLTIVAQLCRLNLDEILYEAPREKGRKPKKHFKEPLWPKLIYLFCLYITCKLIITTYYQFELDYYKHRLDSFIQISNSYVNLTVNQQELRDLGKEVLVKQYEEIRGKLKAIGSPYMNAHHLVESAYIFILALIYIVYFQLQLYYRYVSPFDYSIIFTIIAPEKLQHATNKIICDLMNKFIISSRIYNELLIDQETSEAVLLKWREEELRKTGPIQKGGEDLDDLNSCFTDSLRYTNGQSIRAKTIRILRNHKLLIRGVKSMSINGHFQPFNRRPDWLKRMRQIYLLLEIYTTSSALILLAFFMFVSPHSGLLNFKIENDTMDLIFQIEIFVYLSVGLIACSFYITLVAMKCVDQVYFVNRLNKLINDCILENAYRIMSLLSYEATGRAYTNPLAVRRQTRARCSLHDTRDMSLLADNIDPSVKIAQIQAGDTLKMSKSIIKYPNSIASVEQYTSLSDICPTKSLGRYQQVDRDINLTLMHTILSYKVFVRQLRPVLESFPYFVSCALIILFLPISITRLLTAYLSQTQRQVSLLVCFVAIIGADIVLLLVSRLHKRCIHIYRCLQNLMAHILNMDNIVKQKLGQDVYDDHLIWLLRKELNHPERLANQFATRVFGSAMTHANLTKYHFWWGIIAVSFSVIDPNTSKSSDFFGSVWRFYSDNDVYIDRLMHRVLNGTKLVDPYTVV